MRERMKGLVYDDLASFGTRRHAWVIPFAVYGISKGQEAPLGDPMACEGARQPDGIRRMDCP